MSHHDWFTSYRGETRRLAFAITAAIALFAPFLVDHRVAAAFGAEVASDIELAQAEGIGLLSLCLLAVALSIPMCMAVALGRGLGRRLSLLVQRCDVHFECAGHSIRHRAHLLHTKTN